jgi:1-acyl-sn-glycerol-3-phosphate acyltransferase
VASLRSCVIVSNHLSYLDPLLMISFYERQRTFVKGVFFRVPVFGWFLRRSGYMPSDATGDLLDRTMIGVASMEEFLEAGGNLFIFPEGRRSRTGNIGPFRRGAFSLARKCNAPIKVLEINGTQRFFQPGRFLFHATAKGEITIRLAGTIPPGFGTAREMVERARELLGAEETG